MYYFLFKTLVTALLIAGISEISKRHTFLASILTALPITSVLIFIWIYIDQKDVQKISVLSEEVFYLVIPSLAFFLILPKLLKHIAFFPALGINVMITFFIYVSYIKILKMIKPELDL